LTCDFCGERQATVHLTEIIDDSTRELHLCEPCAREKGTKAVQQFGLSDLLAGLVDFGTKLEGEARSKAACPGCRMTYEDFRKAGRLGCGTCYETFRRYLSPLLKRIHGSTHHVGKIPLVAEEKSAQSEEGLARLKERLKEAVASEAFEEAAGLRDRVRMLEAKSKKKRA
jgi:protein arginine kinase activator